MKVVNGRGLTLVFGIVACGMINAGQWNVPNSAKSLDNPVPVNKQTRAQGAKIYEEFCVECHGMEGAGDGSKETVEYDLRDILTMQVQADGELLRDGELYWKITHGVGKMPSYAGILTDEERWLMVNHMRLLPPKERAVQYQ